MRSGLIASLIAFVAVSLSGCGTVCNFVGVIIHPDREPRIYGGVLRDVDIIERAIESPPSKTQMCDPRAYIYIIPLAVADPIASFVADTMTLPIMICLHERWLAAESAAEKSAQ